MSPSIEATAAQERHADTLPTSAAEAMSPSSSATSERHTHSLAAACIAIGFFAKQFYLLPSGSFQIGDFFLLLSFVLVLAREGRSIRVARIDYTLLAFVFLVVVVNAIWYGIMGTSDYLRYTSYYVFSLLVVVGFRYACTTQTALKWMLWALRLAILLQLAVFVVGAGRYYGPMRYMGTFNDPNQFGFYIFSALVFIQVASEKLERRAWFVYDLISLYLIIECGSIGMLLGIFVLFVAKLIRFGRRSRGTRFVSLVLIGAVALACFAMLNPQIGEVSYTPTGNETVDYVGRRLVDKANKVLAPSGDGYSGSFVGDRGLTKVVEYPEYLVLGAGEGSHDRFAGANVSEVHSTPISIIFYYGIVPFGLFTAWIVLNIRNARGLRTPFVSSLPILVECFFLLNQRQPLFWLFFAVLPVNVEGCLPSPEEEPAEQFLESGDCP